jgi:ABC-type branched-subunit amino acid transport system ATPase component
MVPGIDGGMVYLGEPTSGMSKQELADLIELIYHFGAERGVEWTEVD